MCQDLPFVAFAFAITQSLCGVKQSIAHRLIIKMAKNLLLISVLLIVSQESTSVGFGKVTEVSAKLSNPLRLFQWSKFADEFEQVDKLDESDPLRSKRQTNGAENQHKDPVQNPVQDLHELIEKIDTMDGYLKSSAQIQKPEDDFRDRRESDKPMEKIGGVKNVERQSSAKRLDSSAESWSKQPISIEFKHRSTVEEPGYLPTDDPTDFYRSPPVPRLSPKIDFVTSNRRFYSGDREGRELPGPKQTYEDYDMHPIFRDYSGRGRDYQIPISRAMYPNRYKGERDYYYRVPLDMRMKGPRPGVIPSPSFYNRYRLDTDTEDQYMDAYGRHPVTKPPKPKRIIYYATLPEIVRKPVDIRNYPRYNSPFPPPSRVPNIDRTGRPNNVRPTSADPTRRPYNKISYPVVYKYSNLDSWSKRPSQYEQISQDHFNRDEERREQERIKENKNSFVGPDSLSEDNKQAGNRMRNNEQRSPWLMQAASEDNVSKGSDRNSERNVFRDQEYDNRNMYQNSKSKEVIMDQEMSDT